MPSRDQQESLPNLFSFVNIYERFFRIYAPFIERTINNNIYGPPPAIKISYF